MSSINFDNPYMLLAAAPLILLFALPFALSVGKSNRNGHNVASLVMHILMAAIVAFASAGTKITTVLTGTEVIVVADVSYSAHKNLDTIDSYIKNLKLPLNCKLGLVTFGKDSEVTSDLGNPSDIASVKDSKADDSETNIAEALTFAGTLFGGAAIKRIVLITDGKQTDASDTYAIRRAVDGLEAQGVRVDAIFIGGELKEGAKEVQISSADYVESTYAGSEQRANLAVQSSYAVDCIIKVKKNGVETERRAAALTVGMNNVAVALDTSEGGTFDYEIEIEAAGDESALNNRYTFTQRVAADIKVLVVTEKWDDVRLACERYSGKALIDVNMIIWDTSDPSKLRPSFSISEYTGREGVTFTRHVGEGNVNLPVSVEQLSAYDEIALMDVDVNHINATSEFISSLDTCVSLFGKSLFTAGDLNLAVIDTPEARKLQDMLPVRYGNSEDDPRLYTIIIDASRSMEQLFHLIVAKQVARRLVDLMNEYDDVCIIAFAGDVSEIQMPDKLSRVLADGTTVRESVMNKITDLEAWQGTVIGAGLESAYNHIKNLSYSDSQVMLITDGLNLDSDDDERAVNIAARMFADGIVTSVFDVGRLGEKTESAFLKSVAIAGGSGSNGEGYFFQPNEENVNEVTFAKAAQNFTGLAATPGEYAVSVDRLTDDVLEGIEIGADRMLPAVRTYVYSAPKASATTVLTVEYKRGSGENAVTLTKPLYAHWRYGNGRVSTFTGTAADGALSNWGEIADTFFDNMFLTAVPQENNDAPYGLVVTHEGRKAAIRLSPPAVSIRPNNGMSAKVKVKGPSGEERQFDMSFEGSDFYLEFDCSAPGKFNIEITYAVDGKEYVSERTLDLAYAAEYDEFASYDASLLHIALDGRGRVATEELSIENDDREVGKYTLDLTAPLLIALAALFVADVAVRKLKWNDIVSFFGLAKKKEKKQ